VRPLPTDGSWNDAWPHENPREPPLLRSPATSELRRHQISERGGVNPAGYSTIAGSRAPAVGRMLAIYAQLAGAIVQAGRIGCARAGHSPDDE
jgi:hypothetical protein